MKTRTSIFLNHTRLLRIFLLSTSYLALLLGFLTNQSAQAQCTSCTSTVSTNVDITFTANGQVICLAPSSAMTYNKTIYTGGFTNISLCLGSNVSWNGGSFNGASTNFMLINNGSMATALTYNTGFTLQNNAGGSVTGTVTAFGATITNAGSLAIVTFNSTGGTLTNTGNVTGALNLNNTAAVTITNSGTLSGAIFFNNGPATMTNTGSITGSVKLINNSSINNYGTFTPSTFNYSGGNFTNYAGGAATIPTTSVNTGATFVNNGTLTVTGAFTNNGGTATLNSTTTITGNLTNNASLNLNGTPTIGGNVINNGTGSITGTGSGCNSLCPTGTITNTGTLTSVSLCKGAIAGNPSTANNGGLMAGSATVCGGSNSGTLTLSGQKDASGGSVITRWESSPNSSFSPATILSNTSTTQTYTNLTVTTYYRAVVDGGICGSLYSTTATVTMSTPTLTTAAISGSPFCAGASMSVAYTVPCSFTAGNVFTAQLSNAAGSFASPTSIGTLASTTSGTILAILPAAASAGTNYRIRVIGSNPVVNGSDNGSNLTINANPVVTTAPTSQQRCNNGTVTFTAATTSTGSVIDWSLNGFTSTVATGNAYSPTLTVGSPLTISYRARTTTTACSSAVATVTATAYAPPVTPTAGNNGPVCTSTALTLSTPSVTGATYGWTGPNSFTSASQNPAVSASATTAMAGIYSVTITVNGCSSATGSTTVTVNARPTATLSGTATLCSGNSTPVAIALTGTQPWSVTYTDGTTPVTVNGITTTPYIFNAAPVSPVATRTYSVTAVNDANCSGTFSGSAVITVKPVPAITNTPLSKTICSAAAVGLTMTSSVTSTYAWTGSVIAGTVTGITSSSTALSINDILTNTGTTAAIVRYVITPTGVRETPSIMMSRSIQEQRLPVV